MNCFSKLSILISMCAAIGCGEDTGVSSTSADAAFDATTDTGAGVADDDSGFEDASTGADSERDSMNDVVTTLCAAESKNCFPIVLAHGFAADRDLIEFFRVKNELNENGFTVYEAEVAPYNSIAVRGPQLAQAIDEALIRSGAGKVNIIAHSMGGLDSRYVISQLGYGDRIASLTTISTPHRGTLMADFFADLPISESILVGALLELIGGGREVADDPALRDALMDISVEQTAVFNELNADDDRVYYQSWAGISNVLGVARRGDDEACESNYWREQLRTDLMDVLLTPFATVVSEGAGKPHDGLVTVESAKWGNFRGCFRADHFDEIGQVLDLFPNLRTGFYHLDFYEEIAQDLASRGY